MEIYMSNENLQIESTQSSNDQSTTLNATQLFISETTNRLKELGLEENKFFRMIRKSLRGDVTVSIHDEIKEYLQDANTVVFAMNNDHELYNDSIQGWKRFPSSNGSKLLKRINWTDVTGILPIKVLGVSREGSIRYAAHGGSRDIRYMTFNDLKLCLPLNYDNNKVDLWRESITPLDKNIKTKRGVTQQLTQEVEKEKSPLANLVFVNDDIKSRVMNRNTTSIALDSLANEFNDINNYNNSEDEINERN